jgi:hypothetical protein
MTSWLASESLIQSTGRYEFFLTFREVSLANFREHLYYQFCLIIFLKVSFEAWRQFQL